MKKLRVTVEGKTYEVLVEVLDEVSGPATSAAPVSSPTLTEPATVAALPAAPKIVARAAGDTDVPSPLAGKVVSIDVKVGDTISEGAQVATVEAMKMNTYIFAPRSGRVDAILVNAGDGVEEGSALMRIL